jgi:hypothetical protein
MKKLLVFIFAILAISLFVYAPQPASAETTTTPGQCSLSSETPKADSAIKRQCAAFLKPSECESQVKKESKCVTLAKLCPAPTAGAGDDFAGCISDYVKSHTGDGTNNTFKLKNDSTTCTTHVFTDQDQLCKDGKVGSVTCKGRTSPSGCEPDPSKCTPALSIACVSPNSFKNQTIAATIICLDKRENYSGKISDLVSSITVVENSKSLAKIQETKAQIVENESGQYSAAVSTNAKSKKGNIIIPTLKLNDGTSATSSPVGSNKDGTPIVGYTINPQTAGQFNATFRVANCSKALDAGQKQSANSIQTQTQAGVSTLSLCPAVAAGDVTSLRDTDDQGECSDVNYPNKCRTIVDGKASSRCTAKPVDATGADLPVCVGDSIGTNAQKSCTAPYSYPCKSLFGNRCSREPSSEKPNSYTDSLGVTTPLCSVPINLNNNCVNAVRTKNIQGYDIESCDIDHANKCLAQGSMKCCTNPPTYSSQTSNASDSAPAAADTSAARPSYSCTLTAKYDKDFQPQTTGQASSVEIEFAITSTPVIPAGSTQRVAYVEFANGGVGATSRLDDPKWNTNPNIFVSRYYRYIPRGTTHRSHVEAIYDSAGNELCRTNKVDIDVPTDGSEPKIDIIDPIVQAAGVGFDDEEDGSVPTSEPEVEPTTEAEPTSEADSNVKHVSSYSVEGQEDALTFTASAGTDVHLTINYDDNTHDYLVIHITKTGADSVDSGAVDQGDGEANDNNGSDNNPTTEPQDLCGNADANPENWQVAAENTCECRGNQVYANFLCQGQLSQSKYEVYPYQCTDEQQTCGQTNTSTNVDYNSSSNSNQDYGQDNGGEVTPDTCDIDPDTGECY